MAVAQSHAHCRVTDIRLKQENRAREEDGDVGLRSGVDIRPASLPQYIQFLPFLGQANCSLMVISPRSRTVLYASSPGTRSAVDKKVYAPGISAVIVPNGSHSQDSCIFAISYLSFSSVCRPFTCQSVFSSLLPLRAAERRSVPILRHHQHSILLSPHSGRGRDR